MSKNKIYSCTNSCYTTFKNTDFIKTKYTQFFYIDRYIYIYISPKILFKTLNRLFTFSFKKCLRHNLQIKSQLCDISLLNVVIRITNYMY